MGAALSRDRGDHGGLLSSAVRPSDGVVKPESYFQQDMEEVLLTCMKPPLPTIKQRTPLSGVT
eukprot:SAG31_NODE_907_length_11081_cov_6.935731_3_plen_63_part_00